MQKCAKENCQKPAAPKMKFCSSAHAPWGHLSAKRDEHTKSTKMEKSGLMVPIDQLAQQLKSASLTELKKQTGVDSILAIEKSSQLRQEKIEKKTLKGQERKLEKNGEILHLSKEGQETAEELSFSKKTRKEILSSENTIGEVEMKDSEKLESTEIIEIPAVKSIVHLASTSQETLMSLGSVNLAIKQLSKQMQVLVPNKPEEINQINSRWELQRAKEACNTARSIAGLIKVKIDAAKAMKELQKLSDLVNG